MIDLTTTQTTAKEQIAWHSYCSALKTEGQTPIKADFDKLVERKKIPLKQMERHSLFQVGLLAYITAAEPFSSRRSAVIRFLEAAKLDTDPGKVEAACIQAFRLITWRNKL